MNQPDPSLCHECGAAVLDYDKHRAWHSDMEQRIRNVNSSFNERLDSVVAALRKEMRLEGRAPQDRRPHRSAVAGGPPVT
jgi:hypothetical protein